MLVARHKKELVILIGVVAAALVVSGLMVPPDYSKFVSLLWLPWLALLGWLVWSVVAKYVFTTDTVSLATEAAFDEFEGALDKLGRDQVDARIDLDTAIVKQNALIDILIGFVDEAEKLAQRRESLESVGKTHYHDPKLGHLLTRLGADERQRVIQNEGGILAAQEQAYRLQSQAYRLQSQALLNRVVEARGRIAQQQMKLRTTDAAIPLLEMNESLGKCQNRLAVFNYSLPEPSSLRRRLLS